MENQGTGIPSYQVTNSLNYHDESEDPFSFRQLNETGNIAYLSNMSIAVSEYWCAAQCKTRWLRYAQHTKCPAQYGTKPRRAFPGINKNPETEADRAFSYASYSVVIRAIVPIRFNPLGFLHCASTRRARRSNANNQNEAFWALWRRDAG